MTATRTQIAKWAEGEIRTKDLVRPGNPRDWEIARRIVERPTLVRHLAGARLDQLVWRLGWMVALTNANTPNPGTLASMEAFVSAAPRFLTHWYGSIQQDSEALNMFWDVALSSPKRVTGTLADTALAALTEQLEFLNPFVQYSALHGFGHLEDPRCRPVIRAFLRTCDQDWLADYARLAMSFKVM